MVISFFKIDYLEFNFPEVLCGNIEVYLLINLSVIIEGKGQVLPDQLLNPETALYFSTILIS